MAIIVILLADAEHSSGRHSKTAWPNGDNERQLSAIFSQDHEIDLINST